MQMIQLAEKDISVYLCTFDLQVLSATISIKFPCHYFIEWRSLNGKMLASSRKHPSSTSSTIEFNQTLKLSTQMLYDNEARHFYKKQTLLTINLVSKSRPDQVKLVGRVNVDLAQIANNSVSIYSEFSPYKLTYCSVNADVTFRALITAKDLTNKQPQNLDKSAFNDFFVFNNSATGGPVSPQFTKVSYPKLTSFNLQKSIQPKHNDQKTTFLQQRKIERQQKHKQIQFDRREQQTKTLNKNFSSSISLALKRQKQKAEDTSFRTVALRKQPAINRLKTSNDSFEENDNEGHLWTLRESLKDDAKDPRKINIVNNHNDNATIANHSNFSQQIDINKKKIADLERKIGDLCKNLEDSKTQVQRRDSQNRQKEQLIMKLTQNENKIRQQFESLKRMKEVSSSDIENVFLESQDTEQPQQKPKQTILRSGSGFDQLYQQKISQALQTQRILQQNQYIIRELQSTRNDLEKKLSAQRSQTQQLQSIWKEKKEHYEDRIRGLEKEKREAQFEIQQLSKYKFRVEEAIEEKNRMKMEYKEVEHELMRARFELNDKIQKNAETFEKLQLKQSEIETLNQNLKELSKQNHNFQKQLTQVLISSEKVSSLCLAKDQQIVKLENRFVQTQKYVQQLEGDIAQNKSLEEEKSTMKQQLNQYNSHMETLQSTIKALEGQIQACQYISRINQNLKQELLRLQQRIKQKEGQISQYEHSIQQKSQEINQKNMLIERITEEKQMLLQKNSLFNQQIQNIEKLLQESFHRTTKDSEEQVAKLKEELRQSHQECEQIMKQKASLEEEIDSIVEEKEETISSLQKAIVGLEIRVESLCQSLNDKQSLIEMKDNELQNRKSLSEQLSKKLEAMQQKQNQMHETIGILQTESKKIFDIIEEKEIADQQIMELRKNTEHHLQIIQELEDTILQLKLEKEEVMRKYYQVLEQQHNGSGYADSSGEFSSRTLIKRLQQAQLELEEMSIKLTSLLKQLQQKNRMIVQLQQKNDTLLKRQIFLQSMHSQEPQQTHHQTDQRDNITFTNQSHTIRLKEMELRAHQEKNMQKFVNEISELSEKVIELEAIISQQGHVEEAEYAERMDREVLEQQVYYPLNTERMQHQQQLEERQRSASFTNQRYGSNIDEKSHEITPIKNNLEEELLVIQSADNNFILSDRKPPISSNRSNESFGSFQYVNGSNLGRGGEIRAGSGRQKKEREGRREGIEEIYRKGEVMFQGERNGRENGHRMIGSDLIMFQPKLRLNLNLQTQLIAESFIPAAICHPINQLHSSPQSSKQPPELKIQKLLSMIEVKSLIIKDLQNKCVDLTRVMQDLEKTLTQRNQAEITFTVGRIRQNSPRKVENNRNDNFDKRSRSPSPSSKIAKNQSYQQKQYIKMKSVIESKEEQIKRLKKNIRLMNLELTTLKNLKKGKIIGGTHIKTIKSQSQIHFQDQQNSGLLLSQTNYFNITNAANPNEKSYIINKNLNNEEESIYDSKRSRNNKIQRNGQIVGNREFLQKRFNVASRVGLIGVGITRMQRNSRVLGERNNFADKENVRENAPTIVQQRLIERLQNTAHFSTLLNQDHSASQFVTTIAQLKQKVTELHDTLAIIQEEKVFLENHLEMFEQEKFCLSSDLNARQIQIYELYKAIIALREEITMLKYQNQSYLRMIEDHEVNVNSIVRKTEENCSKLRENDPDASKYNDKHPIGCISVSNIDFLHQQNPHHRESQLSYDCIMKESKGEFQIKSQQKAKQKQHQQRYSLLEKIERYQKRLEQSIMMEKQKQILQEQVHSKEEIMVDQNQKIYQQETVIRELNEKVQHLEEEMARLTDILGAEKRNEQSHSLQLQEHQDSGKAAKNLSIILYENEALLRQNANLKQQVQFLNNQIDRSNAQFTKLNDLLYHRQQEITHLKRELDKLCARFGGQDGQQGHNQLSQRKQQQYEQAISFLQNEVQQLKQRLHETNTMSPPSPMLLSFLENRIKELYEELMSLKENVVGIVQRSRDPSNGREQQQRELVFALLESMENNIHTTFNVIAQVSHSEEIEVQAI